jgi:cytochrome c553
MSRYINHAGTYAGTNAAKNAAKNAAASAATNQSTQTNNRRERKAATLRAALSACSFAAAAFAMSSGYAQELKGNAEAAAKDKVSMCIGCHGIPNYKASFPHVYYVPKIAGQSEKYLSNALHAYKKGERDHPSMKGIAWSLKDQDIADLAAYYASLTIVQSAAK